MATTDHQLIISPLETKSQAGSLVEFYAGATQFTGFHTYQADGGFGSMQFHHHAGEGFDIWYSRYQFGQPDTFTACANIPVLELHIPFKGGFRSIWDGFYDTTFQEKQFELSYAPFVHHVIETAANQSFQTFDVHYTKVYLQRFAHYPRLAQFLEKVEKGEPVNLLNTPQFLSPAMIRLVNEVLRYDLHASMAPHFYEASALMLLTLALDRVSGVPPPLLYSPYDQQCTTYARDLLTADLSQKYHIKDLARHAGINASKLQHCFKQLFGTTLFDYQQSLRLEHAAHLLLSTPFPIQAISEQCGYADGSNLTAAFKKKFGCTPDQYRKGKYA